MPSSKKSVLAHVALLRGINVGGKNVIAMDALRASFDAMGFRPVRTLIASGNVVFGAQRKGSRALEKKIESALEEAHRYPATVVVRSAEEYGRMMAAIPPKWGTDATRRHYVMFLRHAIDDRSILDEFEMSAAVEDVRYVPGALLWSARIDALARSKVRKLNAMPIYQQMTVRNWNTTAKIFELMNRVASGDPNLPQERTIAS